MSSRRFVIATAICIAATYGAYYEQASYDPAAEAAKARAVYENMARGDAAEAYRRCKEASPDEPCSRTHSETLQRARSYYGQHGGAYNVVNDTQTRNLYIFVAAVSAFVAISQFRRRKRPRDESTPGSPVTVGPLPSQSSYSALVGASALALILILVVFLNDRNVSSTHTPLPTTVPSQQSHEAATPSIPAASSARGDIGVRLRVYVAQYKKPNAAAGDETRLIDVDVEAPVLIFQYELTPYGKRQAQSGQALSDTELTDGMRAMICNDAERSELLNYGAHIRAILHRPQRPILVATVAGPQSCSGGKVLGTTSSVAARNSSTTEAP